MEVQAEIFNKHDVHMQIDSMRIYKTYVALAIRLLQKNW